MQRSEVNVQCIGSYRICIYQICDHGPHKNLNLRHLITGSWSYGSHGHIFHYALYYASDLLLMHA